MTEQTPRNKPQVGDRFGSWEILELLIGSATVKRRARCRCACGLEKEVQVGYLVDGRSTRCISCSSRKKRTTHGDSDSAGNTRLYRIWRAMKWRCNPRNRACKPGYFDRGIRVCEEWARDYVAFRRWALANGYADHLTIDREENNCGYSPENCRWVGYSEQARNTRRNRFATAFGETKIVEAWAEDPRCPVNVRALRQRLRLGWPDELAVSAPLGGKMGPGGKRRAADSHPKS